MKQISVIILFLLIALKSFAWGFWAHKRINRMAVFTLRDDLFTFYKENIEYLTEHAVDPDKRRYAVDGEAPRHYIDLDHYCTYPCDSFPKKWYQAVEKYSEDTLKTYGIVPWIIEWKMKSLTQAFEEGDKKKILKYSADIGHYIADSHVPLHTTENYNGQLTNQYGIHGFWESRLPELFNEDYNYFVGKCQYIENKNEFIWANVLNAHSKLDEVLLLEKQLDKEIPSDQKYSFEPRGETLVKTFSATYSSAYNEKLNGMVEEQLLLSVKHVGDIWYTCWVEAGMPNLTNLEESNWEDEEYKLMIENAGKVKSRPHAETGLDSIE